MRIEAGEVVALYGPSGSGKTTALMLIAALLEPDSGTVLFDEEDLSGFSDAQAASYRLHDLGFVDQSFDLLPGASVCENAALKLWLTTGTREANRRVRPLLERLGLGERLTYRPDQLSMGERQRVMIARALSNDPKLLLADEPTGNLDTQRSREVLELLADCAREQNTAVLLVTHDPQAVTVADHVHALRDGKLVAYQSDVALLPTDHR
jgi:putative ABC transport system ATP-binding protein